MVAVVTLGAFLPSLQNDFVRFDDHINLLENPAYRGLGWSHLRWMWTTTTLAIYQPVVWLTWALDYRLWGLAPFGYHLTNLLVHALSAVVVYALALELGGAAASRAAQAPSAGRCVAAAVGRLEEAVDHYRAALRVRPGFRDAEPSWPRPSGALRAGRRLRARDRPAASRGLIH